MDEAKKVTIADAIPALLELLRSGQAAKYGYDLYVDHAVRQFANPQAQNDHTIMNTLCPVFSDAAWELSCRGLIRPGVRNYQQQAVDQGAGYSLTTFGRQWLSEAPTDPIIIADPNRLTAMFGQARSVFGEGFYQRAVEASRSYFSHNYLSTCVMCGAAAESILLAIAIAKTRDEKAVLAAYAGAQGRSRVENIVLGQADQRTKSAFHGFLGLLKDWRDTSGHGTATKISGDEAGTALDLLARFAVYAEKEWSQLIA